MVSFGGVLVGVYAVIVAVIIYALCCADRDADPVSCQGRANRAIGRALRLLLRDVPSLIKRVLSTVFFCSVPVSAGVARALAPRQVRPADQVVAAAAAGTDGGKSASAAGTSAAGDELDKGGRMKVGYIMWRFGAWCVDWTCNRANPLMQLLFVFLVGAGYVMFLRDCMPYIHEGNTWLWGSWIHRYTAHVAVATVFFCFYKASFTDPGHVTRDTLSNMLHSFKYDEMIYHKKHCETCKIQRPARAKHCNFCGHCVSRFDHHCPWINNCVGEYNVKWFHAFLLSTSLLCLYESWAAVCIALFQLDERGLMSATVIDRSTGGRVPVPKSMLLRYVVVNGGILFPLSLFCGIVSIVMFGFWAYHFYLIYINETTNETFKWWDYSRFLRHYRKQLASDDGSKEIEEDEHPIYYLDKEGNAQFDNIYDGGFRQNVGELLFPRSRRARPVPATPKHQHAPEPFSRPSRKAPAKDSATQSKQSGRGKNKKRQ